MRRSSLVLLLFTISLFSFCQETVYDWDWKKEKYVIGTSMLLVGGTSYIKYKTPLLTAAQLASADVNSINALDRTAVDNENFKSQLVSDILGTGSLVMPLVFYFSDVGKKEIFTIGGMAFETMLLTVFVVDGMKVAFRRSRPYTYNENLSQEDRLKSSARFSYPSGHTGSSAALSFFTAKVFSDLHPESRWKPAVWTAAITIPAVTGFLRYHSGNHFPTDIITGYALGAGIGYLVPLLHNKEHKDLGFSIYPIGNGLAINYQF